jgi:coenzyme F420 hydrogenase subunit beta
MRLAQVLDANLCLGCGLCASIIGPGAARMVESQDGFLRPTYESLSQEADALIDRTCPGGFLQQDDPAHQPVWGPVLELHRGWARDERLRFEASSGGALSAVLEHLLAQGEAEYVLQTGAAPDVPWRNASVETVSGEDVLGSAGSRYAPSAPLADIVQRLAEDRRFVFVGKPCDVAALRMYGREDPRVGERVVAMVSFMCGGVPSEHGLQELLEVMQVDPGDVRSFRYRGRGWPGRATATLADGSERSITYAEAWGETLSKHVQPRCKICPDGEGAFADLVFADAWEVDERGFPAFDERDGQSVVLARTDLGKRIVRAAEAGGRLRLAPMTLGEVETIQAHQARRTRMIVARLAGLRAAGRRVPRYRGLRLVRAAMEAGPLANLRGFAGAFVRSRAGRV